MKALISSQYEDLTQLIWLNGRRIGPSGSSDRPYMTNQYSDDHDAGTGLIIVHFSRRIAAVTVSLVPPNTSKT
jgi:hypothetical protein